MYPTLSQIESLYIILILCIYRIYGHTVDSKRWEKIHIEHMKQRDDCETWETISQTEYVIK